MGLGIEGKDMREIMSEATKSFVASKLSYGASCEKTGEMVACRLGKILTREFPSPFSDLESIEPPNQKVKIKIFLII